MGLWICWITIMKFKFRFQHHKFQYIFQSIFWPTLDKFDFVWKVQNVKAISLFNQNSHCIINFSVYDENVIDLNSNYVNGFRILQECN